MYFLDLCFEIDIYPTQEVTERTSKYHFYPPKFYNSLGISYFKNTKVKKLVSASKNSYMYLDTDLQVPFHVSLLATGSSKYKKRYKMFRLKNYFIADSIFDKIAMNKRLKDSKKIVIRNLNLDSVEIASLIKTRFPDKKLLILDAEAKTSLHKRVGPHVARELIHWLKDRGIQFNLGKCFMNLEEKPNGDILIKMEKKNDKEQVIKANMIIDADNLVYANNELLTTK